MLANTVPEPPSGHAALPQDLGAARCFPTRFRALGAPSTFKSVVLRPPEAFLHLRSPPTRCQDLGRMSAKRVCPHCYVGALDTPQCTKLLGAQALHTPGICAKQHPIACAGIHTEGRAPILPEETPQLPFAFAPHLPLAWVLLQFPRCAGSHLRCTTS